MRGSQRKKEVLKEKAFCLGAQRKESRFGCCAPAFDPFCFFCKSSEFAVFYLISPSFLRSEEAPDLHESRLMMVPYQVDRACGIANTENGNTQRKKKTEHTRKGKKEKKNYLIKHPKKEK
jgi:hypothetical protein